jgi:glycosyltransferase involved in cell wall biosynthesis
MSAPIRVVHVLGGLNCGGAENVIMNWYRQIDTGKIQFDFAVHAQTECYFDREVVARGGRILRLPNPSSAGFRQFNRSFRELLNTSGPYAAVHSHVAHFSGSVLRVANRAGVPIRIAHSHTVNDGRGKGWPRRMYRAAMKALLVRHGTHLLGCSQAACDALYGQAGGGRIRVVPNAIALDAYEGAAARRAETRIQLGIAAGTTLMGHVGRFVAVKNHRFLAQVFAGLTRLDPQARLVLIGEGELHPELRCLFEAVGVADRVQHLGVRSDVPALLAAMDVFVFPSLYEGLGLALIEAQAAGTPALASDTIPPEADLKLGLVRFLSLQAEPEDWAAAAVSSAGSARPPWTARGNAIRTAGYDVHSSVANLTGIYTGGM